MYLLYVLSKRFWRRRWISDPNGMVLVAHSPSYPMDTGDSLRKSGRGVKVSTHLHLTSRIRMGGAIPPLP